jgi:uncharacterized protein
MPEYLTPGVYVEEVSFRATSIEGVPTSVTGFAGMTRFGPVRYTNGPTTPEPRLVTSFTEFERTYGGLEPLGIPANADTRLGYVAHAVRAFFANGGKLLYISRVFVPRGVAPALDFGLASLAIPVSDIDATWRARWPGAFGNVLVETRIVRSGNVAFTDPVFGVQARRATAGSVVEILAAGVKTPAANAIPAAANLRVITEDPVTGKQTFVDSGGGTAAPPPTSGILLCEMQVIVTVDENRIDVTNELGGDPAQRRWIGKIFGRDNPEDQDTVVWMDYNPAASGDPLPVFLPAKLLIALRGPDLKGVPTRLTNGNDGQEAQPDDLLGVPADLDDPLKKATGLEALGEVDEIAIVALPDGGTYALTETCIQAADRLIQHATNQRYRIAIVDGPQNSSLNAIRQFRGRFDTKYAALYYPWIEILNPLQRPSAGTPPDPLTLPPSGFVAGIYARTDVQRGVFKAPANEVVQGLTKFELNINADRQAVLNPEGINALRFFPGRGNRVWGARTMTSDAEWKYVNVRRLFIFVEHSIDKGTQFAVFEPNGPTLWANVTRAIEDFLLVLWRDGGLLGEKPEQAFFVRCDRTTMTQNDLDNGRLICLIGIAPVKPAEFVIFRIGQFTAESTV